MFIGGPNPALRDEQPCGPAHYAAVCERFGDPTALDRYNTIFVDSMTVAGRLCFGWCNGQPEALSEKTGKPDVRGAYGLHGREMIGWLTHLQHKRAKNVWFVGILDAKLDDLNRKLSQPQIDGSKTPRPGSSYRNPEHNRAVGGANRFRHLDGAVFGVRVD